MERKILLIVCKFLFLIIQRLKELLVKKNLSSSVGDEGGFAPSLDSDESAIELILSAIHNAGFLKQEKMSLYV